MSVEVLVAYSHPLSGGLTCEDCSGLATRTRTGVPRAIDALADDPTPTGRQMASAAAYFATQPVSVSLPVSFTYKVWPGAPSRRR